MPVSSSLIYSSLHTVAEIRQIETAALASLPAGVLMQRAGRAAADYALTLLPSPYANATALVLAGPGNNGGDALEAAHLLSAAGVQVTIMYDAGKQQPADAQQALARARRSVVSFADPANLSVVETSSWSLVIDGLFGIGLTRPLSGKTRELVEAINQLHCPVLALDVPSGLDADTGNIVGNGIAVHATHTITFIANKPGLHTCFGRDHAGIVQVATLGLDDADAASPRMYLTGIEAFSTHFRRRPHNSHKGSYGDVIVLGGAAGMSGAPVLAARAAAKCGAGRVFAAFLDAAPAYDPVQPELMCRHAGDIDFTTGTLVVGPGLGTSQAAHDVLLKALQAPVPLVLDADALNLIAREADLATMLAQHAKPALMTPHPLEAARLLQTTAAEIQADRLSAARRLAWQFNCIVILKGSGSIIAKPDGEIMINPTGGPALATAGTGDVLAGICGALLAQSFPTWSAALAATWLHGKAADMLEGQHIGPIGVTASELLPGVRALINQLADAHAARQATAFTSNDPLQS